MSVKKVAGMMPVSAEMLGVALETAYSDVIRESLGLPVDPFNLGRHGPWPYQPFMDVPLKWTKIRLSLAGDPTALAVLDLHAPGYWSDRFEVSEYSAHCTGCEFSGYEGEPPDWPCATVQLLARTAA